MDLAFLVPDPDQLAEEVKRKNTHFTNVNFFFFEVAFVGTIPTKQCLNTHHIGTFPKEHTFSFLR
jgi:hypothetical protein